MDSHTAFVVSEVVRYNRVLAERVRLNRQIEENPYWFLPVYDRGHEDFEPVGRGAKSSDFCGKWLGLVVCKNVEGHRQYGDNKVVVLHKHAWCHKATCPVCFIRGWSVRGAQNIFARLEGGVKRGYGKVEHLAVSVPPEDYGLSEKVLREKSRSALLSRGVFGGCMIFHGYRIDKKRRVLAWSPHYHVLGFILGGYDRCRNCKNQKCIGYGNFNMCRGFEARTRRLYEEDGYIVQVAKDEFGVKAERKNVVGTAWYQLNHATVRVSAFRRFHVVTWFGVCGNRMYAGAKFKSEDVCPVCSGDMAKSAYMGKRYICKDIGEVGYQPWFVDDMFDEKGEPNYVEVVGSLKDG